MILTLWLACTSGRSPASGEASGPVDALDSADDTGLLATAPLRSPPEAEDLDEDPDVLHVRLVAAPFSHTLVVDGEPYALEGYAYNGQIPGPTLRAKRGDTVIVELENELPDPTTLHWHGLSVPHEMDGHTWMMDPVEAGGSFTYTFTLEQSGTAW